MINEFKEFSEYTVELRVQPYDIQTITSNNIISGRLLYKTISEYMGIERVLTTLARGLLFHKDPLDKDFTLTEWDTSGLEQKIEDVKDGLAIYLSKNADMSSSNKHHRDILRKNGHGLLYFYLNELLSDFLLIKEKTPLKKTSEVFNKKYQNLSKSLQSFDKKINRMSIATFRENKRIFSKYSNTFTIDQVIAKAIEMGPLKHTYIKIHQKSFKTLKRHLSIENRFSIDMLFTLAYFAANHQNKLFQVINKVDFINWIRNNHYRDVLNQYIRSRPENTDYMVRHQTVQNSANIISFSQAFLKDLEIHQVDHMDIDFALDSNYVYFIDCGIQTKSLFKKNNSKHL